MALRYCERVPAETFRREAAKSTSARVDPLVKAFAYNPGSAVHALGSAGSMGIARGISHLSPAVGLLRIAASGSETFNIRP